MDKDTEVFQDTSHHKKFPACEICISGRIALEESSEDLLEHIKTQHLPLHCRFCKKSFSTKEDLICAHICIDLEHHTKGTFNENHESAPTEKSILTYRYSSKSFNTFRNANYLTSTPLKKIPEVIPVIKTVDEDDSEYSKTLIIHHKDQVLLVNRTEDSHSSSSSAVAKETSLPKNDSNSSISSKSVWGTISNAWKMARKTLSSKGRKQKAIKRHSVDDDLDEAPDVKRIRIATVHGRDTIRELPILRYVSRTQQYVLYYDKAVQTDY